MGQLAGSRTISVVAGRVRGSFVGAKRPVGVDRHHPHRSHRRMASGECFGHARGGTRRIIIRV